MIRPRPRARSSDGPPRQRRSAALLGLATASSLCVFAACALWVPGLVFGAEPSAPKPGPEIVVETTVEVPGTNARPAGPAERQMPAPPAETAPALAATEVAGSTTATGGSLLVTLPWGSGSGEVGLAWPDEGLTHGPEALAVAPDGRMAVLDSVNGRVVLLDALGQYAGSITVPLAEPRFLAIDDELLYVLDCDADRQLLTVDWSGGVRGLKVMPSMRDVVTGLFATSRGPCVEVAHAFAYLVSDRSKATASLETIAGRPVDASMGLLTLTTFAPGTQPLITSFLVGEDGTVSTSTSELDLAVPPGRGIEHLLSVDGDLSGGLIVGARLLDSDVEGEPACLLLRRFVISEDGTISPDPSGAGVGGSGDTLMLFDSSFAYVGQPYTVASDGMVFQPVATESGYAIFVHQFGGSVVPAQAMEVSR